jgi:hypothetical protein
MGQCARTTVPIATTASKRPDRAIADATTGISYAPGTHTTCSRSVQGWRCNTPGPQCMRFAMLQVAHLVVCRVNGIQHQHEQSSTRPQLKKGGEWYGQTLCIPRHFPRAPCTA